MDLAVGGDLVTYSEEVIPDGRAAMLVRQAQALVRAHCGWSITLEEDITVEVNATCDDVLFLPTMRLRQLHGITDADDTEAETLDLTNARWSSAGLVTRGGGWRSTSARLAVRMTHGYDSVPDDVQAAVLNIAMRAFYAPPGMLSRNLAGSSEVYTREGGGEAAGGISMSSIEEKVLERYRIPGRVR